MTCEKDPLKVNREAYRTKLLKDRISVIKDFEGLDHLANPWSGNAGEIIEIKEFVVSETKKIFAE